MSDVRRSTLLTLLTSFFRSWKLPFAGEIYDYAAKLDLQRGYAVKGKFDISTAPHLKAPFQAIRNPRKRQIVLLGAVQTLKSLICDLVVPYWIEHDPGDTCWYLEDDPKAKLYADSRCVPLIKSVPEIAQILEGVDRNDKTKTKIKFPTMNLQICGLNEGNVQSITWRRVICDEVWLHKSDGLVRQAKDRTTQYPWTSKIIVLSQAGEEGDDMDLEWQSSDQAELHWACPFCHKLQPFGGPHDRKPDLPVGWMAYEKNDRTCPGGRWNFDLVAATAHYRCWYCDAHIDDNPELRRRLADSFEYFPQNASAQEDIAGFHWPAEASLQISFAWLLKKYLRAKVADEEQGYRLPLKEFFQKQRAIAWREDMGIEARRIVYEAYDVKSDWPEAAHRFMLVDCQRDLKKFYYVIREVSKTGDSRMLERGIVESFEKLAAKQSAWKVPDQKVFLDCGYEMTKVLRECVRHGHAAKVRVAGQLLTIWACWTGLKGSAHGLFQHTHRKTGRKDWRMFSERKSFNTSIGVGVRTPRAPWYEWSNLHVKDVLRRYRDQEDAPKFLCLPDELPANDQNSYYAQMRSEHRTEQIIRGVKVTMWQLIKDSRPNHYWDLEAMFIAVCAIVGIIGGQVDEPEDPE